MVRGIVLIFIFSSTRVLHGDTQSVQDYQDFDHGLCVTLAHQLINICSDQVITTAACPDFCNRCHIGHWSEWSSWGSCSNSRKKERSRTCGITSNSHLNGSSCINGSIEYDRTYCNNPSCMPPEIVNLTMSSIIGGIATIHCEVSGNPEPLITWIILDTKDILTEEIRGNYSKVLRVMPKSQSHSNMVKCRALNWCGSTESTIYFAPTGPPSIIG